MARQRYIKPWIFGIVAGIIVVLAEFFGGLYPPTAYSFCLTCHTRDLVNTILNLIPNINFQRSVLSQRVLLLTSPGVTVGALIGSLINREFRYVKSIRPIESFIYGFLVMFFGLIIFGCPTRLWIRAGYGDVYGLLAVTGLIVGVYSATVFIKRRFSKL